MVAVISSPFYPFIYLFLEKGEGRKKKRGRDTSMCGCLCVLSARNLARNPGMCPDWEWNRQPFGSQAGTQSTELRQPGLGWVFSVFSEHPHIAIPATNAVGL